MSIPGEVRIRNVDPAALAKIEQFAKKAGMSRNMYLKRYIETLSVLGDIKELENRYTALVTLTNETMKSNTTVLSRLVELLESQADKD